MKNYKIREDLRLEHEGVDLYRIEAIKDFGEVKKGDIGGFVEHYDNVIDEAWVAHNAMVYSNAQVSGKARIYGSAKVFGDAEVSGEAEIFDEAEVYGEVEISGNVKVYGDADLSGRGKLLGDVEIADANDANAVYIPIHSHLKSHPRFDEFMAQ